MKKKAELAAVALTLMFLCFSIGFFAGRRTAPTTVSTSAGVVTTPPIMSDMSVDANAFSELPAKTPSPTPIEAASPSAATPQPETPPPTATASAETPEPSTTAPLTTAESHYDAEGRLRINLATQAELEVLPGIGEVLASRIIEFREKNGGFNRTTTLKNVSGIGDKRYEAIKDLITVE